MRRPFPRIHAACPCLVPHPARRPLASRPPAACPAQPCPPTHRALTLALWYCPLVLPLGPAGTLWYCTGSTWMSSSRKLTDPSWVHDRQPGLPTLSAHYEDAAARCGACCRPWLAEGPLCLAALAAGMPACRLLCPCPLLPAMPASPPIYVNRLQETLTHFVFIHCSFWALHARALALPGSACKPAFCLC